MSQRTTSFSNLLLIVYVAALGIACGRGSDGSGDTTTAGVGATGAVRTLAGDLSEPADSLTEGELWVASEPGRMDTVASGGAQPRWCGTPFRRCYGTINAIVQDPPGPGNVNANGTVIAVLTNVGNAQTGGSDVGPERLYGTEMDPNKRFLMVAFPDGPDRWRWEIRVAVNGGTTRSTARTGGKWKVCDHTGETAQEQPSGKSKFHKCKRWQPDADDSTTVVSAWVVNDPLAPGWLECSAGCCTAGQ